MYDPQWLIPRKILWATLTATHTIDREKHASDEFLIGAFQCGNRFLICV